MLQKKPDILMLAYQCFNEEKGLNKQVEILDRFGLNDNQIALICGLVVQSARNARLRYMKTQKNDNSKTKGVNNDGTQTG